MSSISEKQDAHNAATTTVDSGSGSVEVLTADALQLASLGHHEQLEQNFGLLALAGVRFVCSGSWSGMCGGAAS